MQEINKKLKGIYFKETIRQIQNAKYSKRQLVWPFKKVKIFKNQMNKQNICEDCSKLKETIEHNNQKQM